MADKNPSSHPEKPEDGFEFNESLEPSAQDQPGKSRDPFGIDSVDPDGVIDHTGTIGATEMSSIMANGNGENGNGEQEDYLATHQIDDDYLDKIHSILPSDFADSAKPGSKGDSKGSRISYSESMTVEGFRIPDGPEEMIPPLRDIQFPSDTATIEEGKTQEPSTEDTDEYRILSKLGSGGYGIVYEAQQSALSRAVAVKVLKPRKRKGSRSGGSRSGSGTGETRKRQGRFLHEAKITARLQHPNIIPLYDFGVNPRGELFYSMKKVEKRPWTSIIKKPLQLLQISAAEITEKIYRDAIKKNVEIFSAVCDGMAYSHSQNIIHRDLKPENIMIGNYNEVLIIDFGMALDLTDTDQEFTAGGTLVYMAPEMARHYDKQRAIQYVIRQTARHLGEETGSIFIDQAYVHGVRRLAEGLIKESEDPTIAKLAADLLKLDDEEKELAQQITEASDIYLLGAILYEIAVGTPPHYYPMKQCVKESARTKQNARQIKQNYELRLALNNSIQQYEKPKDALCVSLREIALKAMATDPKERYQSVKELQDAIQGFQLQVQSLELTETGKDLLAKASGRADYQHLLPALESFRGAKELWPDEDANSLQIETACSYGNRAFSRKDFDAGLDIIDEYVEKESAGNQDVVAVRQKLEKGKQTRKRNRTLAAVGWIAAVILPIVVAISSALIYEASTRDIRLAAKEAESAKLAAETETQNAKELTNAAVLEKVEAENAKQAAEIETNKANELRTAALAEKAQAEKDKQAAEIETGKANELRTAALAEKAQAEKDKQAAELAKTDAENEAKKFQFDSEFVEYSSNVLSIPLDFRKGAVEDVQNKLTALEKSDAKEDFKNGWLVKHYRKKANVQFAAVADIEDTQIVSMLGSGEKSYVVANKDGKPVVVEMNADGTLTSVPWQLPESGNVTGGSISDDGRYLAIAMEDNGNVMNASVAVFDTTSGATSAVAVQEQLLNDPIQNDGLDEAANELQLDGPAKTEIIGCRFVKFATGSNGALRLTSVEELSGKVGLKRRLQIVTRVLSDGEFRLNGAEPIEIGATMRDEKQLLPKYLADIRSESNGSLVVIAYPTLDSDGADSIRLETHALGLNGESRDSSSKEVPALPTAIHIATDNKLFCGFADGGIDEYDFANLESGPQQIGNTNEARITAITTTPDGRMLSTGDDGKIVIWNDTSQPEDNSVLIGQANPITSIEVKDDVNNGLVVVTGDNAGGIRFWKPDTNRQKADARLDRNGSILRAAIDQGVDAGLAPAVAIGNRDGDVLFYGAGDLLDADSRYAIPNGAPAGQSSYKFKIRSPFKSIDVTFDDFDAMGIIEDDFFVLNDDGTFSHSHIDASDKNKPAAESSRSHKIFETTEVSPDFVPLVASVSDRNYFFSTHPADPTKLLAWTKRDNKYLAKDLQLERVGNSSRSFVRQLAVSPDGQWIATVRKIRFRFVTQIYRIGDSQDIASLDLSLVDTSEEYSVGEPAFIAFSPSSDEFVYHFHRLGVERETWIERLSLSGGSWSSSGEAKRIGLTKHGVVSWIKGTEDKFIAKLNKQFYVTVPDQDEGNWNWISARGMRPTVDGSGYYVLDDTGIRIDALELQLDGDGANVKREFKNAKAMRIFGDRIVVLDEDGFHLLKQDLTYETKLASQRNPVGALSLSNGKLAVVHQEQSSCRIFDVAGEKPKTLGKIVGVQKVEISRNGRFAAAIKGKVLCVYDISAAFEKETFRRDVAENTKFKWVGDRDASRLVLAEQDAGEDTDPAQSLATRWTAIDVATNQEVEIGHLVPASLPKLEDFSVSLLSSKYMATQSAAGISLWAIGLDLGLDGEARLLDASEAKFDVSTIDDVASFAFSEIRQNNVEDIATRLVVLSSPENADATSQELGYFLLANEVTENEQQMPVARFRVEKIDGALEITEGRSLISADFSGDGKSLIQVDGKGVTVLLSE